MMKRYQAITLFSLTLIFVIFLFTSPSIDNIFVRVNDFTIILTNYSAKITSIGQWSGQVTAENTVIVKHPQPRIEPGIMFLQTSTELNPSPLVTCSIESAARLNPNKPVYYFMRGFTGKVSAYREPEYKSIRLLSSFKNVIILPLNPKELFSNTPLAGWYEKVDPSNEEHWLHVLADGCRIALLWKYGGIYLDTDIISLKPLEFRNFLCEQSSNYANNAALGFNRSHSFTKMCLRDFVDKYNGAAWGHQGPDLMTRMLKKWCGTDNLNNFRNKDCKGIMYLSSNWFYPVPYSNWGRFFQKNTWNNNNDAIKKEFSKTSGVHIWKYMIGHQKIEIKASRSLIEYFFSEYCPSTYKSLPSQKEKPAKK
ncbi:lactosylceramide 4-alpha-galactosyltransferase-like isoform X1 [Chiloscyllium punctatum]|uniref:lactosylceramide 4-alpha-galactosyltransferase-like isoform X1 n=2 Tax=Chiloscyllium punctatum TaxID=137246 RepID=UPI003B634092